MLERLRRWLQGAAQSFPTTESAAATDAAPASMSPTPAPVLVIDVRSEREFQTAALQGAINLPLPQLERRIRELVDDPATPIALYCASGARSGIACRTLKQMGYAQVSNAGGLFAAAARLRLELRQ